ncbi:hypothetical protein EVA_20966, partial [gut metagenome]
VVLNNKPLLIKSSHGRENFLIRTENYVRM